jgi:putative transposase
VRNLFSRGDERLTEDEIDAVLASPRAAAVDQMLVYSAVGTPGAVVASLDDFRRTTGADELVVVHHADTVERRLRSVELLADALRLDRVAPGS